MKKFVNDIESVMRESLGGLVEAHPGLLRVEFEPTFVARAQRASKKVALLSGGGSGHEPLHAGFVGRGMLDAACPGQVFTSPTPDQMLAAAAAAHADRGVLFIVKNYAGDSMNFQIASEMLDIENATVLVNDDVAVENSKHTTGRRDGAFPPADREGAGGRGSRPRPPSALVSRSLPLRIADIVVALSAHQRHPLHCGQCAICAALSDPRRGHRQCAARLLRRRVLLQHSDNGNGRLWATVAGDLLQQPDRHDRNRNRADVPGCRHRAGICPRFATDGARAVQPGCGDCRA